MSEQNGKVVDMNGATGTEDIKGTDFVEPQGKGRKIITAVLKGLALVASAALGFVLGRATGNKDEDSKDSNESAGTNDTENNG